MAAKKKKKASASSGVSKTQFVLALPRDLSAKAVVIKAKEKGLKLSEAYVYKIRSSAKGGAADVPRATKSESKAAPAAARKGSLSKVDFVRSLPPGTSYAEAAAQAKPLGIELSKAYFYVLKSEAKKAGKSAPAEPKASPRAAAAAEAVLRKASKPAGGLNGLRLSSDNASEQAILDAVRVLGASRARSLIEAVEKFERG